MSLKVTAFKFVCELLKIRSVETEEYINEEVLECMVSIIESSEKYMSLGLETFYILSKNERFQQAMINCEGYYALNELEPENDRLFETIKFILGESNLFND